VRGNLTGVSYICNELCPFMFYLIFARSPTSSRRRFLARKSPLSAMSSRLSTLSSNDGRTMHLIIPKPPASSKRDLQRLNYTTAAFWTFQPTLQLSVSLNIAAGVQRTLNRVFSVINPRWKLWYHEEHHPDEAASVKRAFLNEVRVIDPNRHLHWILTIVRRSCALTTRLRWLAHSSLVADLREPAMFYPTTAWTIKTHVSKTRLTVICTSLALVWILLCSGRFSGRLQVVGLSGDLLPCRSEAETSQPSSSSPSMFLPPQLPLSRASASSPLPKRRRPPVVTGLLLPPWSSCKSSSGTSSMLRVILPLCVRPATSTLHCLAPRRSLVSRSQLPLTLISTCLPLPCPSLQHPCDHFCLCEVTLCVYIIQLVCIYALNSQ
jgi:hypothetical protein